MAADVKLIDEGGAEQRFADLVEPRSGFTAEPQRARSDAEMPRHPKVESLFSLRTSANLSASAVKSSLRGKRKLVPAGPLPRLAGWVTPATKT
jgi:hypothetical protein